MTSRESTTDLSDLVGLSEKELSQRFGPPEARTETGGELWFVHATPHGRLRLRCSRREPGAMPRVASWTVDFPHGHETLRGATEAIGLWPAAAPDVVASDLDIPLARRPLRTSDGEARQSLTATIRGERFTRVSVFDEAPDWL